MGKLILTRLVQIPVSITFTQIDLSVGGCKNINRPRPGFGRNGIEKVPLRVVGYVEVQVRTHGTILGSYL